jgi:cytochrome P450
MTTTSEQQPSSDELPTGVKLTPLDDDFQQCPYPAYDDLRERDPVHHDSVFGRWLLTRHDDVEALLRSRKHCVDPRKAADGTFEQIFLATLDTRGPSILFLDAPDHTRLRGLVSKAFTPRAVDEIAPRIQEIVDELLDAVSKREGFDLIGEFAGPLPTIVIAEMLGVDPDDQIDFKRWSNSGIQLFDPTLSAEERQRMTEAQGELSDYFQRAIAARRAEPRGDLISSLIAAEEAGDQLTDDEIVTMCSLLLTAGNVTTTDLIGSGVLALLQHPEELRKLRDNPEMIENAVEEMLRYDSPVQQTGRIPMSDVEFGGRTIAARQSITPQLGAANRDPSAYPEPSRFDISREDVHHHSFGGGAHYCLGAPLARLEARIGIGILVRRFTRLRLVDGPLEYRRIPSFRGLVKLDVLI